MPEYFLPKISIVTPVLNGAKTIERTLQSLSVQRADFEHIVMDGGSKDDTEVIVRSYENKYPVQWHSQPDKSIYEGVWNGMQRTGFPWSAWGRITNDFIGK